MRLCAAHVLATSRCCDSPPTKNSNPMKNHADNVTPRAHKYIAGRGHSPLKHMGIRRAFAGQSRAFAAKTAAQ